MTMCLDFLLAIQIFKRLWTTSDLMAFFISFLYPQSDFPSDSFRIKQKRHVFLLQPEGWFLLRRSERTRVQLSGFRPYLQQVFASYLKEGRHFLLHTNGTLLSKLLFKQVFKKRLSQAGIY